MKVEIKPHEADAIMNLILLSRALAQFLEKDPPHVQKVMIWAQMAEDFIERMEGKQ